jgi:hypothetical protein
MLLSQFASIRDPFEMESTKVIQRLKNRMNKGFEHDKERRLIREKSSNVMHSICVSSKFSLMEPMKVNNNAQSLPNKDVEHHKEL